VEVDAEEMPPEFDAGYYGGLLEKAWDESGICVFHG